MLLQVNSEDAYLEQTAKLKGEYSDIIQRIFIDYSVFIDH